MLAASDDTATALFESLGAGRYQATALARGPWDARALHGGPVAALTARALERALSDAHTDGEPHMQPARFTLELERPVGLDPVSVTAEVVRPGRSVRTADVTLHDDAGRRLARATLVAIRQVTEPLDLSHAVRPHDVRPSTDGRPDPTVWKIYEGRAFHRDAVEHRFVDGSFARLGIATDWIRLLVPVVDGEEPSPLQRVVAAADFGNGISAAVPHADFTFINPDLTVVLHRLPVGTTIGLEASTRLEPSGVGAAQSLLWDEQGRIGLAVQSLVLAAR